MQVQARQAALGHRQTVVARRQPVDACRQTVKTRSRRSRAAKLRRASGCDAFTCSLSGVNGGWKKRIFRAAVASHPSDGSKIMTFSSIQDCKDGAKKGK